MSLNLYIDTEFTETSPSPYLHDRMKYLMTLCKSLFPHANRLLCDKVDERLFTYTASN